MDEQKSMKLFVFRNNTIERFFPKKYLFSGYDDVSYVPLDVDGYVWFYQLPVKYEVDSIVDELDGYTQKLQFILPQIGSKLVVSFTIDIIYSTKFIDSDHRLNDAVLRYNNFLYSLEKEHENVKVVDICDFTRQYSWQDLIDWRFYFISQMGLNPRLSEPFQSWWLKKLDSIALRRKKCLVIDLDNTLWGGVLGEDGVNGIKIGGDYPGKAFLYFQEALLELNKQGVILTICSKNNEQDVIEAWENNPFLVLRREHFAAYRINWNDKATNIKELADELNIGLDSFVFVDDNPTERELIKQVLPMVEVPEFPTQPYELPVFFKNLVDSYFKVYSLTEEDVKKTEQYKANAARNQAQSNFADFGMFLESLDLQLTIEPANDFNIPRIAQMTQKTNQFNLTTKRYTDINIRQFINEGWKIWCLSVADKFGDNGITGCLMFNGYGIDTLLLSCRILGKGIETAFVKTVMSLLLEDGIKNLRAVYLPTKKNSQVKDFYDRCGFDLVSESETGEREYQISLNADKLNIDKYYHIIIK